MNRPNNPHKINVQNVVLNACKGKELDSLVQEWEYRKDRVKYKILKPKDTFHADYVIRNGFVYAIFDHKTIVPSRFVVCKTAKTNDDWKSVRIEENKTHYFITI